MEERNEGTGAASRPPFFFCSVFVQRGVLQLVKTRNGWEARRS